MTETYELHPTLEQNQKSFYGKAIVRKYDAGHTVLFSHNVPIVERESDGTLIRLWNSWSTTTGKHIKAFCGLNKTEFLKLPLREI